jgi:tape measure domain-containing protein
VILGAGIYQGLESFGKIADVYTNLQNRIGGITSSQAQANNMFERLVTISNKTRSSLESTGEAYVRIHNATETMNLSQEDQYKLITRINMALQTSGASASEARSGMMQLTQALAKGKLDGDEFRSIAENMPNILKILEKSLGVTEGRLRSMSKAGELTREKIVNAFLKSDGIEAAFNKTKATFGQTFDIFKNNLTVAFGKLAEDKDLVAGFAFAMEYLAKAIILVVKAIGGGLTHIRQFVEALKEGKVWAYALAGAIGLTLLPSIINLLAYVLKLPAAFIRAAAAGRLFGALGGTAGGVGAAEAAAAGGAAASAGSKGGKAGLLGFLGPAGLAVGAALTVNDLTGGSLGQNYDTGALGLVQDMIAHHGQYQGGPGGAGEVNIGPTSVTIYAKDGKDAAEQFDQSQVERMMRHAAAAWNRNGS